MKRLDFTGYVFITTTHTSRMNLLHATLTSVMSQVTGARFCIQWMPANENEELPAILLAGLFYIADVTGNDFDLNLMPYDSSVAESKHRISYKDATHFVNLDDDLLVRPESLRLLLDCKATDVVTIGVVDANNSRGFADYDTKTYDSLTAFTEVHELSKAKHHFFKNLNVVPYKWISQLYCLRRRVFLESTIWLPIRQTFAQKGVRGYDIMLEQLLVQDNYTIDLIQGCEAIHLGMEHAFIGGQWTEANPVTEGVVHVGV